MIMLVGLALDASGAAAQTGGQRAQPRSEQSALRVVSSNQQIGQLKPVSFGQCAIDFHHKLNSSSGAMIQRLENALGAILASRAGDTKGVGVLEHAPSVCEIQKASPRWPCASLALQGKSLCR